MEEAFLHFVWKFQQFNRRDLKTHTGLDIIVFNPGFKNTDAGPDFKQAKIKIGNITWNGNVEIHVESRDWFRHQHQHDESYDNVILHVVWKNNSSIKRKDESVIPTLELKDIVDERLILNYRKLVEPRDEIVCRRYIGNVRQVTILGMLDKVLAQRLEARSGVIFREIAMTNNDWEEIAWRMLCKNFGFKTNAYPFVELGKSVSIEVLKKESHSLKTIEALLFGQAGFLEEQVNDGYFLELKNEYKFKQKKYKLERRLDKHQWKFLRLRPANFPTIRLAQLASLIYHNPNLFSLFVDVQSVIELKKRLRSIQSAYWLRHYNFGIESKKDIGSIGVSSIENILINTIASLLFAYGIHRDQEDLRDKAMELLTTVNPEKNTIIKKWTALGLKINSSFDSQALIELYTTYCVKKRCLNCSIGAEIIKGS